MTNIEQNWSEHPFKKREAIDFVRDSPLDGWLQNVTIAKIDMEETVDHPRILGMLIGESLELAIKAARGKDDVDLLCKLCKFGLSLKFILFEKDIAEVVCGEDCEFYARGNPLVSGS